MALCSSNSFVGTSVVTRVAIRNIKTPATTTIVTRGVCHVIRVGIRMRG